MTALIPGTISLSRPFDRHVPPDEAELAAAAFLSRYQGRTLDAYRYDLRAFFQWAADQGLEVLKATRPQIELYLRAMEERGLAATTIDRRLSTVCGFYRFAHIDGRIAANPAQYVRRPKVHPPDARGLDRSELGAFLFTAERFDAPHAALAVLLGLNGLRVSEACSATSKAWASSGATARCTSSGRATSRPSSPSSPGPHGRSTWPSASERRGRSCCVTTASGSTGGRPTGGFDRSPNVPAWARYTRTCSAPPSDGTGEPKGQIGCEAAAKKRTNSAATGSGCTSGPRWPRPGNSQTRRSGSRPDSSCTTCR